MIVSSTNGGTESKLMRLSEAFSLYYQKIAFMNQSPRTAEMHWLALRSLIKSVGDIPIADLTFVHIMEWKTKLENENKSQNTIRGYIIKLRIVLAHLNKERIDCLDVDLVPVPKRENTVPSWITPEEVTLLIDTCSHRRAKAIISLLYASGIRVSELTQLNRDQLHEGRFTVIGKGNKPRLCFYDRRTSLLLDRYLQGRKDNHPALFVQRQTLARMNKGGVEEVFRQVRLKAGIAKPITPHTLRHSFATDLAQRGLALHNLQRLMGHANIQTTSMYLHTTDIRLEEEYTKYHTI